MFPVARRRHSTDARRLFCRAGLLAGAYNWLRNTFRGSDDAHEAEEDAGAEAEGEEAVAEEKVTSIITQLSELSETWNYQNCLVAGRRRTRHVGRNIQDAQRHEASRFVISAFHISYLIWFHEVFHSLLYRSLICRRWHQLPWLRAHLRVARACRLTRAPINKVCSSCLFSFSLLKILYDSCNVAEMASRTACTTWTCSSTKSTTRCRSTATSHWFTHTSTCYIVLVHVIHH